MPLSKFNMPVGLRVEGLGLRVEGLGWNMPGSAAISLLMLAYVYHRMFLLSHRMCSLIFAYASSTLNHMTLVPKP